MTAPPAGPSDEGYDPRTDRDWRRVEEEAPGVSRHEPIVLRERLSLNRMGTFDWDLDRGFMELDPGALDVFDLRPGEYDGAPLSLAGRVAAKEGLRLDEALAQALQDGHSSYGAYFRVRCRDGTRRWTHSQGRILHDPEGTPYRVIGIVREATGELADSALLRSLQQERQRQTVMVQQTTAALSRALSVRGPAAGGRRGLPAAGRPEHRARGTGAVPRRAGGAVAAGPEPGAGAGRCGGAVGAAGDPVRPGAGARDRAAGDDAAAPAAAPRGRRGHRPLPPGERRPGPGSRRCPRRSAPARGPGGAGRSPLGPAVGRPRLGGRHGPPAAAPRARGP
ncbi:PAS domain-containing protein [Streptomyces sp. NRRL S-337]|uniref:PAS domain-containing protein n=1 Tax=Streptomyces sp. NRRL S-337 TaxID=1463900 RepID=UPI000AFE216E